MILWPCTLTDFRPISFPIQVGLLTLREVPQLTEQAASSQNWAQTLPEARGEKMVPMKIKAALFLEYELMMFGLVAETSKGSFSDFIVSRKEH